MRQPAPAYVKELYAQIKELFGGAKPIADRYGDDHEDPYWVDVMRTADSPQPGVTSYATLGMSRFDNGGLETEDGTPLRVELLGACQSEFTQLAPALNSCALNVAKSGYQVQPGVVHPNVLAIHANDIRLRHLLLVTPFLWGAEPSTRIFDDLVVEWLLAVPISDSEVEFARRYDSDRLQQVFATHQIDMFDINRPPVV